MDLSRLPADGILDDAAFRRLGRNQIRNGMFPNLTTGALEWLTASTDRPAEPLPRRSP